ncbi:MAG: type pilus assembly protein PilN [Acidobacteriota bacterium]|jgi:Tfp pilus assembly protein PilN|nr:type pilus assembly protein PilN [Acidobacteriota bacterium]
MIKVNLLDSVTERASSAAAVEAKVANPATRFWMLGAAVFGLLALAMVFDYFSAAASQTRAKEELERQEQIAAQMAAVNKEQAELEKKLKDIQSRIDVIKKLRASQQGPVSLLSDVNSRIPSDPDFRLETIEQKNGDLTIEGQSPNEYAVTQFGHNLEFSDGLFLNVNLEAERKQAEINPADYNPADGQIDPTYKPEVFRFKIKCKYGPSVPAPQPQQQQKSAPAPQVAQK